MLRKAGWLLKVPPQSDGHSETILLTGGHRFDPPSRQTQRLLSDPSHEMQCIIGLRHVCQTSSLLCLQRPWNVLMSDIWQLLRDFYDAGFGGFSSQLYVLLSLPPSLSCALRGERVDAVVRLCRALQGHGPQAEQDGPAGAAQRRRTLSPSGGARRLRGVLVPARALSQLTWWETPTWIPPHVRVVVTLFFKYV